MSMVHNSWAPADPEPSSVLSPSSYDISIIHHAYTLNPNSWPVHPLHAIETALTTAPSSPFSSVRYAPHPALHWALRTASSLPSFPLSLLTTYALHRTAELNRPDMAALLLTAYGADPTSMRGLTLRAHGTHALVAALLRAHLSPNALLPAFHSVHPQRLIRWVLSHHAAVVLLLSQGAEAALAPSVLDHADADDGLVLLDYAAVEAGLNTFKLLQRHGAALGPRTLNLAVLEAARLGAKPAAAQRTTPGEPPATAQTRIVSILRHLVLDDAEARKLLNASDASVLPGLSGGHGAADDALRIQTRRLGTPLMYAVSQPHGSDVFLFLLRNGADPRVPIVPGGTATVFVEAQRLRNSACWRHLYNWETTRVLRANSVRWAHERAAAYGAEGKTVRREGRESGWPLNGHAYEMVVPEPVPGPMAIQEIEVATNNGYGHAQSYGQNYVQSYSQGHSESHSHTHNHSHSHSHSWSNWDSPVPGGSSTGQTSAPTMLYPDHYGRLVQDLSPSSPTYTPTTPLIVRSSDETFGPNATFLSPTSAGASSQESNEDVCMGSDMELESGKALRGEVRIVELCRPESPPDSAPFPGESKPARNEDAVTYDEVVVKVEDQGVETEVKEFVNIEEEEEEEEDDDTEEENVWIKQEDIPEMEIVDIADEMDMAGEMEIAEMDIAGEMEIIDDVTAWDELEEVNLDTMKVEPGHVRSKSVRVRSKSAPPPSFYEDPFEDWPSSASSDDKEYQIVRNVMEVTVVVVKVVRGVEAADEDEDEDEDKENRAPVEAGSEEMQYAYTGPEQSTGEEEPVDINYEEEVLYISLPEVGSLEATPGSSTPEVTLEIGGEDVQDEYRQLWNDLDDPVLVLHASGCLF